MLPTLHCVSTRVIGSPRPYFDFFLSSRTKRRLITGFFAFTIFLHVSLVLVSPVGDSLWFTQLGVSLAAVGVVIDERTAEGTADILMK